VKPGPLEEAREHTQKRDLVLDHEDTRAIATYLFHGSPFDAPVVQARR
jgi:hypothetical protein